MRLIVAVGFVLAMAPSETPFAQSVTAGPTLYVAAHMDRLPPTERPRAVAALRRLGIKGVRLDVNWATIERQAGKPNWAPLDSVVDLLERAGLSVYGVLAYAPSWARPAHSPEHHRPSINRSAKAGDAAFGAFAAEAARHYRGRIEGWEVWNEPNSAGFWVNCDPSAPSAWVDYSALYRVAVDSIRAAQPSAAVVVGGLASLGGRPVRTTNECGRSGSVESLPAADYLARLLKTGVRPAIVGLHPYSGLPPGEHRFGESRAVFPGLVLDSVLRVLTDNGLPNTQLWITEWGVDHAQVRSDRKISDWYRSALTTMACDARLSHITVYALWDDSRRYDYGLVDSTWTPTPAGRALAAFTSSPVACR